jgi:putative ABC transport system permease protein
MHGLRQDLRYAARTLLKAPGFTLMAVLTLALGIGANTAIFSLVNGLLLERLPFTHVDRLMLVHLTGPDFRAATPGMFRDFVWSYKKYQDFLAEQHAFEDTALFSGRQWSLTGTDTPERLQVEVITGRYLSVLGITPLIGRDVLPSEDRSPGIERIVLISHALWQRRFGGDCTGISSRPSIRLDDSRRGSSSRSASPRNAGLSSSMHCERST